MLLRTSISEILAADSCVSGGAGAATSQAFLAGVARLRHASKSPSNADSDCSIASSALSCACACQLILTRPHLPTLGQPFELCLAHPVTVQLPTPRIQKVKQVDLRPIYHCISILVNMARSLHPGTLVAWVCLLMAGSAHPAAAQNYAVSQEGRLQLQNDAFSLLHVQQGLP